jgi:hypothetical protein
LNVSGPCSRHWLRLFWSSKSMRLLHRRKQGGKVASRVERTTSEHFHFSVRCNAIVLALKYECSKDTHQETVLCKT